MFQLLVLLFIIKLYARSNIFKYAEILTFGLDGVFFETLVLMIYKKKIATSFSLTFFSFCFDKFTKIPENAPFLQNLLLISNTESDNLLVQCLT